MHRTGTGFYKNNKLNKRQRSAQDNNNIIISDINPKKQGFKWLNVFLCCFKTN